MIRNAKVSFYPALLPPNIPLQGCHGGVQWLHEVNYVSFHSKHEFIHQQDKKTCYQHWELTGGKIQIVWTLLFMTGEIVHSKYSVHKCMRYTTQATTHTYTHTYTWMKEWDAMTLLFICF